ncbi:GroES-like protein, partial [Microstroma glucosiphilum]
SSRSSLSSLADEREWNRSTPAASQSALLIRSHSQGWARCFELHPDWPSPRLSAPDEVLVRNLTMGLNPVDWKSLAYRFGIERFPWVLGRDVCGVVESVGEAVENVKVGDRVWTCSDSRDIRAGAYQAKSVHKAFTLGKIPDRISDDDAATIGTGLVTAAVALYWFFGIERARETGAHVSPTLAPSRHTRWLLIFGGGAVTGLYALQLAHLSASNVKVLCVASPSNFAYLQSLGADACIDRFLSSEAILHSVRDITGQEGVVDWALDCVGSSTAALCQEILSTSRRALGEGEGQEEAGQLICLAGNPKRPREEEEVEKSRAAEPAAPRAITIHRISFSTTYYSSQPFTSQLLQDVHDLLACGSLRTVQPLIIQDGLAGVRKGLEMLRDGECPRTRKLVVRMEETPKDLEVTVLGQKEELGWNGCV